MDVVIRASVRDPAGLQTSLRNIVHEFDKDLFVPTLEPLQKRIGLTLSQPRFNMMLLGAFAGVALILAAIGIYGVIAYTVAQRTREIGIRMALGAQRIDMLTMILRQSFTVIGIGLVAGIFGALAVTRLMSSLLYGVSAKRSVDLRHRHDRTQRCGPDCHLLSSPPRDGGRSDGRVALRVAF